MRISTTQLQRGPCLKLMFSFVATDDDDSIEESEDLKYITINNLAMVSFKYSFENETHAIHSITCKRHESVPTTWNCIRIKVTCEQLNYSEQFVCGDKWLPWKIIGKVPQEQETSIFNPLKITLIVTNLKYITFKHLYTEIDFCDFYLKTVHSNASVPVHKACLSLHSDVFKRMLQGEWKENKTDSVEIEGVTLQNLEDFKKYIYLGILPSDGLLLRPLLLLAKCYMINNLLADCTINLALTVKPEELYSLQEFAIDNKIPELMQAIVQITSDETVHMAYKLENVKTGKNTQCEEN